jgi:hypothetical protein
MQLQYQFSVKKVENGYTVYNHKDCSFFGGSAEDERQAIWVFSSWADTLEFLKNSEPSFPVVEKNEEETEKNEAEVKTA